MARQEQLQEQYEDALFALLMSEVAESEGRKALAENERLQQEPSAEIPEELDRRCLQVIRTSFAKRNIRTAGRVSIKAFGRIAMVLGFAAILFTTAFALSETLRITMLNLATEILHESTDFYLTDDPVASSEVEITMGWLPDGYTLEAEGQDLTRRWWLYRKSDTEFIQVICAADHGTVTSFDTEEAKVTNIQVHDVSATLIEKEDGIQLIWGVAEPGAFISVLGIGISRDELVHVANSMQY